MSRVPSPLEQARHWLGEQGRVLGLPIAILLIVGLAVLMRYPFDRPVPVAGTVTTVERVAARGSQTRPAAFVRLPNGHRTFVFLSEANACRAGGPIHLLRYRSLIGPRYTPAAQECGPSR